MINFLLVGLGGMFGAISRYGLSIFLLHFTEKPLSYFTILAINLIGCFGIGLVNGLSFGFLKPEARLLLVTGFLGGFTTYSAFAFETFDLLHFHQFFIALVNITLHIIGGLAAVWLGNFIARSF